MTDTRLTLRQAAAALGVSESAIRKRVERGTLRSDKGPDGRRYVYLDTVADTVADEGEDTSDTRGLRERDSLTSELRDRLRYVEGQLEAERQAHAEARRIIAGLVERIPAIEAPASPEATEPPSQATEQPGRVEPQPAVEGTRGEESSPFGAQESHEMHMPEAGGGPLPRDQQTPSSRRWWEFWR